MPDFSLQIKKSNGGDEYYSPQNVVDMIVPYILNKVEKDNIKTIWCPFDKEDSNFVKTFQQLGIDVVYGHIETGQDFFNYDKPQGDIVVSNPPYSKREAIFERLYEMDIPFALVMNLNGLFDSRKRREMFEKNGIQLLVPYGRMKFIAKDKGLLNAPNFQSIYVCSGILEHQIEWAKDVF